MVNGVARDGWQGRFTRDILGSDLNRYTKLQSRLILNIPEGLQKNKSMLSEETFLFWRQPGAL